MQAGVVVRQLIYGAVRTISKVKNLSLLVERRVMDFNVKIRSQVKSRLHEGWSIINSGMFASDFVGRSNTVLDIFLLRFLRAIRKNGRPSLRRS